MGLVLYSTMALASPYLQNVIGYPIITAGVLLASRGCGTFVAMMLVGRMMRYIEARTLIITGLGITALSLYYMAAWTDQTGVPEIVTATLKRSSRTESTSDAICSAMPSTLPSSRSALHACAPE